MAGRIPQDFIDNLLNRVDIVDVVGARLTMKRSGDNFLARCPFHDEKTPSFTVSRSKQFYHCFGCGAHGSAIGFIMNYDNLDFPEAVEVLAAGAGLEVPREHGDAPRDTNHELFDLLERCNQYFKRSLRAEVRAVEYLRGRGLSGEIARDFSLGFAPDGWDGLAGELGESALPRLATAGMVIANKTGGFYDRFRDRIMFPIRDTRGRCIAFGGRAFGDATPKYLNSPETPVFHKRREVYGLYELRQSGMRDLPILVVEGYMDVIALHQFGAYNTVATLGTAVTSEQVQRLYRDAHELVFCFDGDAAGARAAWRALEVSLPLLDDGREARFLLLDGGDDPDSLIRREGADDFQQRLRRAPPASEYLLRSLREQTDTQSIGGRARLAELARPLIAKLPAGLYKDLLTEQLGREVGARPQQLQSALRRHQAPERVGKATGPLRMTPLRLVIALLLSYPRLAAGLQLPEEIATSDAPGFPLLRELRVAIAASESPTTAVILQRLHDHPDQEVLARLARWESQVSLSDDEVDELFADSVTNLVREHYRRLSDELLRAAEQRELDEDEKQQLNQFIKRSK